MSEKTLDWTKPVQTRDGRKVTIFTREARGEQPLVGQIEGCHVVDRWFLDGGYLVSGAMSDRDLVNTPETKYLYRAAPSFAPVGLYVCWESEELAQAVGARVERITIVDGKVTAVELLP